MVKIRLQRAGAKKRPFYRVVAIDQRSQLQGRPLELLGTYDPRPSEAILRVNFERLDAWVSQGAQISDTLRTLVRRTRRSSAAAETRSA